MYPQRLLQERFQDAKALPTAPPAATTDNSITNALAPAPARAVHGTAGRATQPKTDRTAPAKQVE